MTKEEKAREESKKGFDKGREDAHRGNGRQWCRKRVNGRERYVSQDDEKRSVSDVWCKGYERGYNWGLEGE